ncbi:Mrr-like domain-containing protein [[Mycoplasma] cavipharyngis]|uniref:restriction endonuclease n=1 Tax=[Mycoplasma] cavipharyngis TaxID=92757 RepID=UPI003704C1FF
MTNLEKYLNILNQLEKSSNHYKKRIIFEILCKKVLETAPFFSKDVKKIWKWHQFPAYNEKHYREIDFVVQDNNDQYWAILCDYDPSFQGSWTIQDTLYNPSYKINKKDINSFITASSTEFTINGITNKFSQKYIFTTTNYISVKTEETIIIFEPKKMIGVGIDWNKFDLNQFDKNSKLEVVEKEKLTNNQIRVVNKFISNFQKHDYWTLNMKYGTTWYLTSLRIVERLYDQYHKPNQSFNILYLAPSIGWILPAIFEWKNQTDFNNLEIFGFYPDVRINDEDKNQKNFYSTVYKTSQLFPMPIPMISELKIIAEKCNISSRKVNIFFSSYESIDAIIALRKKYNIIFDVAVTEEIGSCLHKYSIDDNMSTNFLKSAKRWLDMTREGTLFC